jgi:hypothetical protein
VKCSLFNRNYLLTFRPELTGMVHMTRSTMLGKLAALQQTSAQEVDAARESIKWPPHRRLGTASQAL